MNSSEMNIDVNRTLQWAYRAAIGLNLYEDNEVRESLRILSEFQDLLPPGVLRFHAQRLARRIYAATGPDINPYSYYTPTLLRANLDGELRSGWVQNSQGLLIPFGLDRNESAHTIVPGATNAGKSTFQKTLYYFAMLTGLNAIIFEPQEEFLSLKYICPDLLFFNRNNLRMNPLQPPTPRMHPDEWLGPFVDAFCENQGLLHGGNSILLGIVKKLYRANGIYDGSRNYPHIAAVYEYLLNPKNKSSSHSELEGRSRIRMRLEALLGAMGENLNCSQGLTAADLRNRSAVFQLGAMKESVHDLVASVLVAQLYFDRMLENRTGPIDTLIGIDEASWLFGKRSVSVSPSSSIWEIVFERIRKYGCAFLGGVQRISGVAPHVLANCNNIFYFYSRHGDDKSAFGRAAQLQEQQYFYLNRLPPKTHCIVSTTKFDKPLMLKTVNIDKYLPRTLKLTKEDVLRSRSVFLFEPPQAPPKDKQKNERLAQNIARIGKILSDPATKYIPRNQLFQKLNLSKLDIDDLSHANKLQKLFVIEKVRTTVKAKTGGRTTIFLRLPNDTHYIHDYWVLKVQEYLKKQGIITEREKFDCDIVETREDGTRRGFEFERSGSKILKNIERNLRNGFQSVVIVCDSDKVLDKVAEILQKHVGKNQRPKIKVMTKYTFFAQSWREKD